jgi:putative mycofactocin binding protein MftB
MSHVDAPSTSTGPLLERGLRLHPKVALRPEPFGALAYHYDTRRLVFLKHPDVVRVVTALGDHPSVADALAACEIAERRYPAFERAIAALVDSDMLTSRLAGEAVAP